MSNRTITLSMVNDYPFNISNQYGRPGTLVQVRKIIENHLQPRHIVNEKIDLIKNMNQQTLIKLVDTLEQNYRTTLIFQYVHRKMDNEIWNMSVGNVERVRRQMEKLAQMLASYGISHQMRFDNVGLEKDGGLKYFLDFNFRIDKHSPATGLEDKYMRKIEEIFGEGGRFARAQLNAKKCKREFSQTMDSNKYQNEGAWHQGSQLAMKRSATTAQGSTSLETNLVKQKSLVGSVAIPRPSQSQHEICTEIKKVNVEDIGQRINRLRDYVKNLTGLSPKNNTNIRQLIVKVDDTCKNRITEENKLFISPNYTRLEKKIAEWRESKFYRAYGEKQILYRKDSEGYQIQVREKLQGSEEERTDRSKQIEGENRKMEGGRAHFPKAILSGRNSVRTNKVLDNAIKKTKSMAQRYSRSKEKNYDKSINSSKGKITPGNLFNESSYENEYHKLAHTDKYCQQFMMLLQDEPVAQDSQEGSCTPMLQRLIGQLNREVRASDTKMSEPKSEGSDKSGKEIKNRVNQAIRNSLKLINGMKHREH